MNNIPKINKDSLNLPDYFSHIRIEADLHGHTNFSGFRSGRGQKKLDMWNRFNISGFAEIILAANEVAIAGVRGQRGRRNACN